MENKKIIVLIRDTSGSIFTTETSIFQQNLADKLSKKYEVYIMDADSKVRQQYKYEGRFKQLQGGGGTCFIDSFNKALELQAVAVIYATDCYAPFPEVSSVGKLADNTVWLTFNQEEVNIPFGEHYNIDFPNSL